MSSAVLPCMVSLLAWQVSVCQGKRVAVLPLPFASHNIYHTNVARALVERGHEVWLIIVIEVAARGVLNTTGCNIIQYSTIPDIEETFMSATRDAYFEKRSVNFQQLFGLFKAHNDKLLTDTTLLTKLRALDLDLFIIDNLMLIKILSIIPYRLNVPFAFLGTGYDPFSKRIPFSPAVTPMSLFPFTDRPLFLERVRLTVYRVMSFFYDPCGVSDAVSRYAPEMPDISLDLLVARAEIWLVETDHVLDYPKPSIPNVKLIGGAATGPANPLPDRFKSFMDGATEGVVVVSFGSYVLNLPAEISDKIFTALQKLPFKSVFRSKLESPDPAKIMTSSWLPQNDLIGHKNTRVFVTHCGKNGQYEALFHAVPVVCMPIFMDQPYNAERMRGKGMAERLDLITVSEDELRATIVKVGTEKRYKQTIARASELFHIEMGVPKDRAAFWLDHVMKYGGSHMRSAGQDMPYYQFIGLDVFALLLSVVVVFLVVIAVCMFCICRCLCRRYTRKQKAE
ncbi:UDP-glucuronosyltransferase 2B11-like [Littorina saxatilis]|uniref:UDP-glucuronosyltransferase 2B11-like n=1 Tax=Littorina saxatilis TaxID=31220 RepID=UPI0038B539B1